MAHGTASAAGLATVTRIRDALAAARPHLTVDLCFLDVLRPSLADALDDSPTVAVPLLLSTGYHVRADIPAALAGYTHSRVSRHLGPHPLLAEALADRLPAPAHEAGTGTVVLAGAGSSRPEAAAELADAADLLAARLGRPAVPVVTMAADLRDRLARFPPPVRVATYLLAEGRFTDALRAAAPPGTVAEPLGAHPAVVELALRRYDEVVGTR